MDRQKLLNLLTADLPNEHLSQRDLDLNFNLYLFDALTSTNEKLSQLVTDGQAPPGTIVIADRQTAGRGQRGRTWNSEPGGLYLSLY